MNMSVHLKNFAFIIIILLWTSCQNNPHTMAPVHYAYGVAALNLSAV